MAKQYFFHNDCTGCLRTIKAYKSPLKALEEFSATDNQNIFCFCIDMTKTGRTYVGVVEATVLLRQFARECALDVIHLWKAPEVVVQYLKTGDESLRDVAWAAARDAAWAAARDAARAAAGAAARDAAGDAAGAAAGAAARDAAWAAAGDAAWGAARDAARDAAWDAAWAVQDKRLTNLLETAFGQNMEAKYEEAATGT